MNTKQIWQALSSNEFTSVRFDGVFSYNTLKNIKNKPELVICNTDPSYRGGKHWVLFFFNSDNKTVDFFDSLGAKPSHYGKEFTKFISKFADHYNFINKRIQPKNSDVCGHYCLYYAYWKCKGENMEWIIERIPSTVKRVAKSIQKYFTYCKKSRCIMVQTSTHYNKKHSMYLLVYFNQSPKVISSIEISNTAKHLS